MFIIFKIPWNTFIKFELSTFPNFSPIRLDNDYHEENFPLDFVLIIFPTFSHEHFSMWDHFTVWRGNLILIKSSVCQLLFSLIQVGDQVRNHLLLSFQGK